MSSRDWSQYAVDIVSFIERIEEDTSGMSISSFSRNKTVVDATTMNLMKIGEAAKHIPSSVRKQYPSVPWKDIVGLRNIIVHEYFFLDLDNIWKIVGSELKELKSAAQKILKSEG